MAAVRLQPPADAGKTGTRSLNLQEHYTAAMRSRILKITAVLVVLLIVAGAIFWRLLWMAPAWYRPADAMDHDAVLLAEAVENRLVEEASKVRSDDSPWTLRVRSEQINAWLSLRLPRWLIHEQDFQWPQQLGVPQVHMTPAGVEIATTLQWNASSRYVAVRVVPTVRDDRLYVVFDRLSIGRIPLPGYTLDDLLALIEDDGADQAIEGDELAWVLQMLAGHESFEPVATLADDRRVRLLAVQLGHEYIDLTLQTLPPVARDVRDEKRDQR
jgi:hypothetical protein